MAAGCSLLADGRWLMAGGNKCCRSGVEHVGCNCQGAHACVRCVHVCMWCAAAAALNAVAGVQRRLGWLAGSQARPWPWPSHVNGKLCACCTVGWHRPPPLLL